MWSKEQTSFPTNLHLVSLPEEDTQPVALFSTASIPLFASICLRVSSFEKVLCILKVIFGFVSKCREHICVSKGVSSNQTTSLLHSHLVQISVKLSQKECLSSLLEYLSVASPRNPPSDSLLQLSPFLDSNGLIRVGGRLRNSNLPLTVKHPFLISSEHPLANLIVSYFHSQIKHQGRHITQGAIRDAGFFIQHGSSLVKKHIKSCTVCRRLRRSPEIQKMSDLPEDRLEESPPFTYCGLDVFGPFLVCESKATRRTNAERKVWGLVFTCLVSRAIHIEPLPAMDSSTFVNALRRFFAIRGVCKLLRSDQGSNFIGARNQGSPEFSLDGIRNEMEHFHCKWELNPPKASHFGGVWERKIGSIRRILDASLLELGLRKLSRDELYTFFQEAVAIINNTHLFEVSSSPDDPLPITPAMLLNLKDNSNHPPFETFDRSDISRYGSRRYRRVQFLSDHFWHQWRRFYIHNLQPRRKWSFEKRSISPEDVVLLKDKNLKRNHWPLARVVTVKTSADGLVRSATVIIPSKDGNSRTFARPICDMILIHETVD